jgi:hypothetical protein
MDKFQQLAWDAEYAVAVLANLDTNDTQFVDLQPGATDAARTFAGRGLTFVGVVGLVNGKPRIALEVEMDAEILAQAFMQHVRKRAKWICAPDRNVN